MIGRELAAAVVVMTLAGGPAASRAAAQDSSPGTAPGQSAAIGAALAKVAPSLVRIHVVTVSHTDGREIKREASGSGTIITADGHVVTNHHVAGKTRAIICTLPTREEVPADLVGTDPLSDIAMLKLRPAKPRTFPAAKFGDASMLKVGDRVLALGSPLALSQSVTMGIVSNTEMIMPGMFWPFNRMTLDGEDVGSIVRWIGHDARDLRRQLRRPARQHAGGDRRRERDQHGARGRHPGRPRPGGGQRHHQGRPRSSGLDRPGGSAAAPVVERETRRARRRDDRGFARRQRPASFRATSCCRSPGATSPCALARRSRRSTSWSCGCRRASRSNAVVLRDGARENAGGHAGRPRERRGAGPRGDRRSAITGSNLTSWSAKELRRAGTTGRARARHPAGRRGRRCEAGARRPMT